MAEQPRVTVIILNWNTPSDMIECLDSLSEVEYDRWDAVIVDNGSSDDSVDRISSHLSSKGWVTDPEAASCEFPLRCLQRAKPERLDSPEKIRRCCIIAVPVNRGFTGGNNIAMRFAMRRFTPDYMLLLNNDTIVKQDFLTELVKAMDSHPECGLASPMILDYLRDRDDPKSKIIQYAGASQSLCFFMPIHRRQSEIDDGRDTEPIRTGYAHGTCLIARTATAERIGLLDEDYFCYREENDWALRASKNGYCSMFVPASKVWHKGGKSSSRVKGMSLYYMSRNGILLVKKNASILQKAVFALSFAGFVFPYRLFKLLVVQRDPYSAKVFVAGTRDGLKWRSNEH